MIVKTAKLDDLISISKGRKAPEVFDVPTSVAKRYIQINDLRTDDKLTYAEDPSGVEVVASDLCIAWDGANAGTVGYGLCGYIGSTIARLRPMSGEQIFSPYFGRFLQTKFNFLNGGTTGATIPHVSKYKLLSLEIPLPPLDEQRRIAAILDKADNICRKRKATVCLTEELLRSTFLEMFGDPESNTKGWDMAPIKELGNVTTGNTPSRECSEYYGEGIEWIKSDNINTPFHFLTDAKEHLSPAGQKVGRIVPENSTLVTCIAGSPECIGNAAIANRPVAFNQQINAVTPFKGTDPYFLYVQILVAKKLIQGQSTESMKGMVNKGKFENISFLKPPANLQADFGKIFIHFHGMIQKADSSNQKSTNLFNSLVQTAFRGDL